MIEVTFSVKAKGYESSVIVNGEDPEKAGALIAEWLEFQHRYLSVLKPGERVEARGAAPDRSPEDPT